MNYLTNLTVGIPYWPIPVWVKNHHRRDCDYTVKCSSGCRFFHISSNLLEFPFAVICGFRPVFTENMEPTKDAKAHGKRPALTKPVSIRFSNEEIAELKHLAGESSLSEYVRRRLFAGNELPVSIHSANNSRLSPQARQRLLGQILMRLGTLDTVHKVNSLADAMQSGLIDASPDLIAALEALQSELQTLRLDLLKALGLRP